MRRKWVWGLIGLGLVAVGLLAVVGDRILLRAMQRQVEANLSDAVFSQYADGLHVVLCGAGSPMPDPKRAGPCVAVVAGGQIFVVDVGSGAVRNMLHLGLPPGHVEVGSNAPARRVGEVSVCEILLIFVRPNVARE